jgi:hypothetical protein
VLRHYAGLTDHAFSKKFPLGVAEKDKLNGFLG